MEVSSERLAPNDVIPDNVIIDELVINHNVVCDETVLNDNDATNTVTNANMINQSQRSPTF